MLARCQIGLKPDGRCGAILTYPTRGLPWRRNVMKSFEFAITTEEAAELFAEAARMVEVHPGECLGIDQLWNDASEKANGITRDRTSGVLCYSIGLHGAVASVLSYSMREDSAALNSSLMFQRFAKLIAPYEAWPHLA